jgi:hypothetical protein
MKHFSPLKSRFEKSKQSEKTKHKITNNKINKTWLCQENKVFFMQIKKKS